MHVGRALGHFERPWVLLVRPGVELLLPCVLFGFDRLLALAGIGGCGKLAVGEPVGQRLRRLLGVADDADRDLLHEPEHLVIAVDLDDLRVLRPVVEPVLRQRAERPKPGSERQHDIGLGDELHRRLRSLIAERPAPQRMVGGERIVVEIGIDDRRVELLGERHAFLDAVGEDDAAARYDHRKLAPAPGARRPHRGFHRRPARSAIRFGLAIS